MHAIDSTGAGVRVAPGGTKTRSGRQRVWCDGLHVRHYRFVKAIGGRADPAVDAALVGDVKRDFGVVQVGRSLRRSR